MKSNLIIATTVTVWLFVCGFLAAQLIAFGAKPGESARIEAKFPAASKLKFDSHKFTIVTFLHPQCPCSKATVAELEELMAKADGRAVAYALFIKPKVCNEEFAKSELFEQTSKIKNVRALVDDDGLETKIFGSKTSGQMMVYDRQGCLVFSGGITSSRGHVGDNDGLDAVSEIIRSKKDNFECSAVYGCPLFASTTAIASGRR